MRARPLFQSLVRRHQAQLLRHQREKRAVVEPVKEAPADLMNLESVSMAHREGKGEYESVPKESSAEWKVKASLYHSLRRDLLAGLAHPEECMTDPATVRHLHSQGFLISADPLRQTVSLFRQVGPESVQVSFRIQERPLDDSMEKRHKLYFDEMGHLEQEYHVYPSNVSDYYPGERLFYKQQAQHNLLDSQDPLRLMGSLQPFSCLVSVRRDCSSQCLVFLVHSKEGDIHIARVDTMDWDSSVLDHQLTLFSLGVLPETFPSLSDSLQSRLLDLLMAYQVSPELLSHLERLSYQLEQACYLHWLHRLYGFTTNG